MSVRAKFVVSWKDKGVIHMHAVYSGSEENKQFFQATPAGSLQLAIVNEAAADQFEVGKEYYLDFTRAEQPPK